MKTQHPASLSVIVAILVAVQGLSQLGLGQNQQKLADAVSARAATPPPQTQATPRQAGLTLADLEQMALRRGLRRRIRCQQPRRLDGSLPPAAPHDEPNVLYG